MFGGLFNDRKRLRESLMSLAAHKLVTSEDKKWFATAPTVENKNKDWFTWPDKLANADKWHHQYQYWTLPLPKGKPFPNRRVSLNEWAVYWWLVGWTARNQLPNIGRAAALLGLSRNGWSAARNRLQALGLLGMQALPKPYNGLLLTRDQGNTAPRPSKVGNSSQEQETQPKEPWLRDLKEALAGVPGKLAKEIIHLAQGLDIWETKLVAFCRSALTDHKPAPGRPAHHGHLILHRLKEHQQHREAKADVKAAQTRDSLNKLLNRDYSGIAKDLAARCRTTTEEVYKLADVYGWEPLELATLPYSATLEQLQACCRERETLEQFQKKSYLGHRDDIWRFAEEYGWDTVRAAVLSSPRMLFPHTFKAALDKLKCTPEAVGQLGHPSGAI
jgi:hypothetical protein